MVSVPTDMDLEVLRKRRCDMDFIEKYTALNSTASNGTQIWYFGVSIGTAKNEEEINACLAELQRITNNNEDTFIQIQELRCKVKRANMQILIPEFVPIIYKPGLDYDLIVNKDTNEPVMYFDAKEILDVAAYLKHDVPIDDIIDIMLHHEFAEHTHSKLSEDDFYTFQKYYNAGRLNDIIRFICKISCTAERGLIIYQNNSNLVFMKAKDYVKEVG